MPAKFFLLFFLSVVTASPLDPPEESINTVSKNTPNYRLPEGAVTVSNYFIHLTIGNNVFNDLVFTGAADITFTNNIVTNEIKLHANGLNISAVDLISQNGIKIDIENDGFVSDNVTDILTLKTSVPLTTDSYLLNFTYVGQMRTESNMHGFYRSSYVDSEGKTRFLGTTQFQPVHARKVFPCFDEPLYKAEFDISITHPAEYQAVGNTASSRSPNTTDNFVTTTFAQTPRMSTYLIAFVVSDFTCSGNVIHDGIPHYICSTPASSNIRTLALDYGPNITWALEDFTQVKYDVSKITKIHQFAIPDFSAGAMENWGIITYRERLLLWDSYNSNNRNKQNVITVIAHELAHFWFGNLVTCNWWSNTFLNEGFATYFEYHAPQIVDSSLQTDKQFVLEQLQTVLISDASPSSAPLSSTASSPSQISGRFSVISYNKGGSIFRMVQHFMGLEAFKNGLNKYLAQHQFSNTQPEDLWAAFEEFAPAGLPTGRTIGDVMDNWVNNAGYPVLSVSTIGREVTITQARFLSTGQTNGSVTWIVPVSYTTASDDNKFEDTTAKLWLESNTTFKSPILETESDWIILNNQQTGYYRVDYDNDLWEKIKTALNQPNFDGINELNRAQIVDDFFNFVRFGYQHTFSELLELYRFLKNDTSYYPWYSAFSAFSTMTAKTSNQRIQQSLSAYIKDTAEKFYQSVPFADNKNDDQIYTLSKVLVVPWMCRLGHEDCVKNALEEFAKFRNTNVKPEKNMRSLVYCNGLRHSTDIINDWNFLWEQFQKTDLSDEQVLLLSTLGCATDETVLTNYLLKGIDSNSGIRPQDASYVYSAVWNGNPEGIDVVLNFIINNHADIASYSTSTLATMLSGVGSRITRQEQIDKLEEFINNNNLGVVETTAKNALNTARYNLQWTEAFEEELRVYFSLSGAGSLTVGVTTIVLAVLVLCNQLFQ